MRSLHNLLVVLVILISTSGSGKVSAQKVELRVATWNLEWFNDHDVSDDSSRIGRDFAAPSRQDYDERLEAFAEAIHNLRPTILAVQEVENERVVQDLTDRLQQLYDLDYAVGFVRGHDSYTGQDVALLIEGDVPFEVNRFNFSEFRSDDDFKDLSKHLWVEITVAGEKITLVNVHLVTNRDDRKRQARTLRAWTSEIASSDKLILLGDFNVGQRFNQTSPEGTMGIIRGFGTSATDDDLFDAHQWLGERATHVSGRELDRILVSPALLDEAGLKLSAIDVHPDLSIRGDEDEGRQVNYLLPADEQDLSDHYPLIATFEISSDESASDDEDARRDDQDASAIVGTTGSEDQESSSNEGERDLSEPSPIPKPTPTLTPEDEFTRGLVDLALSLIIVLLETVLDMIR